MASIKGIMARLRRGEAAAVQTEPTVFAGYSRAVVDGNEVFVSGTVGFDHATGRFPEGAAPQAEKAIDIIAWALKEAGAEVLDIVRVRVFIPDRADVPAVSEVVARRLGSARATNTTICSPLAVAEAKVEIEVTARKRCG